MRKELFEENFKFLQSFCGELMTDDEPDYWLDHKEENNQFGNCSAERTDSHLVQIGTFYIWKADVISDPLLVVLFDNVLKIARVVQIELNSYGMFLMNMSIHKFFSKFIDEPETDDDEIEANNYLNTWLKAFVPLREKDPNYFKRIPIDE